MTKNAAVKRFVELADFRKVHVSAQDIADIAGVTKAQVNYWGKAGFLPHRPSGYHQFPVTAVPKARMMRLLASEIGLEAAKASVLADKLLAWGEKSPESVDALVEFLRALYVDFDDVIARLEESGFGEELRQLGLERSEESSEESEEELEERIAE